MTYLCPYCKKGFRLKVSLYPHLAKERCSAIPHGMTVKERNVLIKDLKTHEETLLAQRNWDGELR
jgi:hypothetical protein